MAVVPADTTTSSCEGDDSDSGDDSDGRDVFGGLAGEGGPDQLAEGPDGVREALERGWAASDSDERMEAFEEAEGLARDALEDDPCDADARWWLVASLGFRAQEASLHRRVPLAREVHQEALELLEAAPDHAGAHHTVGRLHAGIERLNRAERWLLLRIVGDEHWESASLEKAEAHLHQALALQPGVPHHRVEMARILKAKDRPKEAHWHALIARGLPSDAPLAHWYRGWAADLLETLNGELPTGDT